MIRDSISPEFPILEHDDHGAAVIEPRAVVSPIAIAPRCVLCFFEQVIARLEQQGSLRLVTELRSTMGRHPIYEWSYDGQRVTLMHPGLGGPLAAMMLEELIALGCRAFVACGGAGLLDKQAAAGALVVPVSAVRDEGTSYHYVPPSREVFASPDAVAAIERTLTAAGAPFILAKTWTTDAVYRETPGTVAARRAEGCLTVEMEAATLMAVAQFRGVPLGQILYGGDDVGGARWDRREQLDRTSIRERLVHLAAEACAAIPLTGA
jgi:uridine phosphorylase